MTKPSRQTLLEGSESVKAFWNLPRDVLIKAVGADLKGLTEAEAQRRLAVERSRGPARSNHFALAGELARLVLNPLVVILIIASVVSALLGDHISSLIVLVIVLISLVLDFYQTARSQAAAQKLAGLIVTTATVRRDGQSKEVSFHDLVRGDLIEVSAGDLVPADCRIIQGRFLAVNEAALTGESLPVDKTDSDLAQPVSEPSEARNAIFLGSSVVSGTGLAVVANIGNATELGHIGGALRRKPPMTEFERGMHAFANLVARTVLFLVFFVFFVNAWFGRGPLDSFLFAVALAVGLTPEFMPMIVTVTLAEGAMRMARKHVIVRHLGAIQNFGSIDILCSDKTGTLTQGKVQVARIIDPFGANQSRVAELAYLNAAFETGLVNPLDAAIRGLPRPASADQVTKVDELPFDFVRRRSSVVLRDPTGRGLLVTKGAPESVIAVCHLVESAGESQPLGPGERATIEEAFQSESEQGFRSLAVAYRVVPADTTYEPTDEKNLTFVGLISFEDPPLQDVATTIAGLERDGITLKILTGDDPVIARHVCEQVGLPLDRVVTGAEVDQLTDPALGAVAEEVTLFARLTPIQKNRIIAA
ncbi:MAG TPA: HAD-IC family P-type ATPase, partial [Chloroflexota bacterium]|nr:HAD-IC family P-type ATPase [Chloroflexota bacterium]